LCRHLDDEAPTTLERDAHHDAPSLRGDLEGTVAGPGLHGRHSVLPPSLFTTRPASQRAGVLCHSPPSGLSRETEPIFSCPPEGPCPTHSAADQRRDARRDNGSADNAVIARAGTRLPDGWLVERRDGVPDSAVVRARSALFD